MRHISQRDPMQTRAIIGDAIGLAAICVMVLVGLTVPALI